jgi:hypothetical protein
MFVNMKLENCVLIDSKPVDKVLAFLHDHFPPQMHLVITTREDLKLPQARLCARGQLIELRASDLCFTSIEAADFLKQVALPGFFFIFPRSFPIKFTISITRHGDACSQS